jgi:putative PIN family toxin of toxin-antitoxin system
VLLTGKLRLVLDTNVWLDWLVFDDPGMAPIRAAVAEGRAELLLDEACAAELERVLARQLGRRSLDPAAQAAALADVRRVARPIDRSTRQDEKQTLPRCSDPDDQKFLEAALVAGADALITKDEALLSLARRKGKPSFRILTPKQWALSTK